MEKEYQEAKVYRVEKFIPATCPNPKCFNPFTENSDSGFLLGTYWMHENKERARAIAESIRHQGLNTDLIVCGKCRNVVMRVMIEERYCETKEEAEKAVAEDGFVNLVECRSCGSVSSKRIVYLP